MRYAIDQSEDKFSRARPCQCADRLRRTSETAIVGKYLLHLPPCQFTDYWIFVVVATENGAVPAGKGEPESGVKLPVLTSMA